MIDGIRLNEPDAEHVGASVAMKLRTRRRWNGSGGSSRRNKSSRFYSSCKQKIKRRINRAKVYRRCGSKEQCNVAIA